MYVYQYTSLSIFTMLYEIILLKKCLWCIFTLLFSKNGKWIMPTNMVPTKPHIWQQPDSVVFYTGLTSIYLLLGWICLQLCIADSTICSEYSCEVSGFFYQHSLFVIMIWMSNYIFHFFVRCNQSFQSFPNIACAQILAPLGASTSECILMTKFTSPVWYWHVKRQNQIAWFHHIPTTPYQCCQLLLCLLMTWWHKGPTYTGINLAMGSANETHHYNAASSLNDWDHIPYDPCLGLVICQLVMDSGVTFAHTTKQHPKSDSLLAAHWNCASNGWIAN